MEMSAADIGHLSMWDSSWAVAAWQSGGLSASAGAKRRRMDNGSAHDLPTVSLPSSSLVDLLLLLGTLLGGAAGEGRPPLLMLC